jgi:hypothetical protein
MPVSISGTNGVTFPDSSLQAAAASPYVLKNRIINGDMRIDQRNAGASVTVSNGTITYITDRWNIYEDTSGAISAQQSTTVPTGFTNSFLTTVTSAGTATSGQLCRLQQKIEGFNVADLGFGTVNAQSITISFWARSSLTGTYCVNVRNSAVDRSYVATYTISSANTFEYKTITIPGDTSGTWLANNGTGLIVCWDLGSGSSANTTAGSWVAGNKENTSAQANWIGTASATFYITGVQLEQNTTATPFERRLYNQELANCQRYYWQQISPAASAGTRPLGVGSYLLTGYIEWFAQFPVPMRAAPSVVSPTVVGGYEIYRAGAADSFDVVGLGSSNTNTAFLYNNTQVSGTAGQAGSVYCNSASTSLAFSAEL